MKGYGFRAMKKELEEFLLQVNYFQDLFLKEENFFFLIFQQFKEQQQSVIEREKSLSCAFL